MADTLTNIQVRTQFLARRSDIDLTSGDGLVQTNMVYRGIAALFDWPELHREDTSLVTTINTENQTWPSSIIFTDVHSIEIEHWENENKYELVMPAATTLAWNKAGKAPNGFPQLYKRWNNGGTQTLSLRPIPNLGSKTIKISGLTEPTALAGGGSTTIFLSTLIDDALAYLVAAVYAVNEESQALAQTLAQQASSILSRAAGQDVTPEELTRRFLGATAT